MKTILVDYKSIKSRFDNLSICLGYFDGVHLGHQSLIKYARKNAKYTLGLITFDKPVSSLINNGKTNNVLTSLDDRFKIISKLGVDYYFIYRINKDFINLSDQDFISLLRKMNVKEVFVGKDYKYGKNKMGTIYSLQDYFDVHVFDTIKKDDHKISAQEIKKSLLDGKLSNAYDLLGRNYSITGTITTGNGIGKTIGFPTINLKLSDNYLLPKFGVYKAICYVDNVPHIAIVNVGKKPTISDNNEPSVEIHLKDVNYDIKGDVIVVEFIEFIREEIKFSSLDELKKQIAKDIKKVF